MRRIDPRLLVGILLILGGFLNLLGNFGVLNNVGGVFWGIIFGAIGAVFLYYFFTNKNFGWWAIIPALALLGMAASSILPASLDAWSGLFFLGGLSAAFWVIYFTDRDRWWGIIPGGTLATLAIISVLDGVTGKDSGGLLFIGMGITFLLVALLPSSTKREWAYYPAVILLIFGAVLGTPYAGLANYIWPAVLVVAGSSLLWRYFSNKE
jgi:hypothetical protein